MAHVLGIDEDTGARVCHGRWAFDVESAPVAIAQDVLKANERLYLTDGKAKVWAEKNGVPLMTVNQFGKGKAVYMSSFRVNDESTRMLLELMIYLVGAQPLYMPDHTAVETAYFPEEKMLVALNNMEQPVTTSVSVPNGSIQIELAPMEMKMMQLD